MSTLPGGTTRFKPCFYGSTRIPSAGFNPPPVPNPQPPGEPHLFCHPGGVGGGEGAGQGGAHLIRTRGGWACRGPLESFGRDGRAAGGGVAARDRRRRGVGPPRGRRGGPRGPLGARPPTRSPLAQRGVQRLTGSPRLPTRVLMLSNESAWAWCSGPVVEPTSRQVPQCFKMASRRDEMIMRGGGTCCPAVLPHHSNLGGYTLISLCLRKA